MAASSLAPRLTDILDAIEHIRAEMAGVSIEAFEADWRKRWLVERGVEIISEASRHLTDELKARHPEIPWAKVAGIGNVLRRKCSHVLFPRCRGLVNQRGRRCSAEGWADVGSAQHRDREASSNVDAPTSPGKEASDTAVFCRDFWGPAAPRPVQCLAPPDGWRRVRV
jgi:uncharacterized protein with HEPN domain